MNENCLDKYLEDKVEEILKDEKEFLGANEYEEIFNYELKKLKEKKDTILKEFQKLCQDSLCNQLSDKDKILIGTSVKIKLKK